MGDARVPNTHWVTMDKIGDIGSSQTWPTQIGNIRGDTGPLCNRISQEGKNRLSQNCIVKLDQEKPTAPAKNIPHLGYTTQIKGFLLNLGDYLSAYA